MQGVQKSAVQPLLLLQNKGRYADDTKASLRRCVSTPGLRALILVLTGFLLYIRYGSASFYRDPGSIFYDNGRAYERGYSLTRQSQGEEFLNLAFNVSGGNHSLVTVPITRAGRKPRLCATVITTVREGENSYVDGSVSTLLDRLTTFEREDLHLKVLFATVNTSLHKSWNEPWLRGVVDEAYSYQGLVALEEYNLLSELEEESARTVKSISDYAIALKHCYESTNAPYIAVFEDDTIVAETWFARTMKAVKDIEAVMEEQEKGWLSMRLFSEDPGWGSRSMGSNSELRYSFILSAVALFGLVLYRRKSYVVRRHLDNWTLAVICLVAIPGIVILFFQSGKASVLPPSAGAHRDDTGTGSQGSIFPRERVPGLIRYLKQREVGQHDLITRDFGKHEKLASFALYPVQMQHVGNRTMTKKTNGLSSAAWSTAFENFNARRLEKQHLHLVSELYHDTIKAAKTKKTKGSKK